MSSVRLRGIEIAYTDEGSGAPIVFLHGFPFNRSMWRDQIDALRETHRVIAPDLRGHGESEVAPVTIPEMARDVAGLLTALDINQAVVGGLSMGGYVALSFCRQFSERVTALLLADTRASADTEEGKQNRALQAERVMLEGMEGIANEMLPKLLRPESKPDVVSRVRQMIVRTKPLGAVAALQAMATRDDQTDFLSRINKPTLILVGVEDVITPLKDSQLMLHEIQRSSLEIIQQAGHVSNLEQPEQFNRLVNVFLERTFVSNQQQTAKN